MKHSQLKQLIKEEIRSVLNESLELTPIERRKLTYFLKMEVKEMQNKGDIFFSDEIEIFKSILNKLK
tara:strand:+ start:99 stop:299 length:201 start_codon:yes stop_codon:yes gene_type:complete